MMIRGFSSGVNSMTIFPVTETCGDGEERDGMQQSPDMF